MLVVRAMPPGLPRMIGSPTCNTSANAVHELNLPFNELTMPSCAISAESSQTAIPDSCWFIFLKDSVPITYVYLVGHMRLMKPAQQVSLSEPAQYCLQPR